MIHFMLLLLTFLGFSMLCLARERHQRDILDRKLTGEAARWLRWAGTLSILAAYPVAGFFLGWSYGAVEWLGQLSVGALLTVLLLARLSGRGRASR